MPRATFNPLAIGDEKAVAVKINPEDPITAASATYIITRAKDPRGYVWDPGGACIVENNNFGTVIRCPDYINFPTADRYTVRFTIVWADGQVDNTVTALIPVGGNGCC